MYVYVCAVNDQQTKDIYLVQLMEYYIICLFCFCQHVSTSNLPAFNSIQEKKYFMYERKNRIIVIKKILILE